jgi:hypothetical protein
MDEDTFFMVSEVSSFIAKPGTHLRNPTNVEDCLMVTLQYHGYWRKFFKVLAVQYPDTAMYYFKYNS